MNDTPHTAEVQQAFDLFHEPQLSNPYPFFRLAREHAPVFYAPEIDHWVISRYQDVKQALRDYENYSARNTILPLQPLCEAAQQVLQAGQWKMVPALGNADRPAHTVTRKNVVKAFTPARVAELEPYTRGLVNDVIDRIERRGHAELMAELMFDLPALVILKLLGFPDEQVPAIKQGAKNRILLIWGKPTEAQQVELAKGLVGFFRLCRELVEARHQCPEQDLTSALLALRADGDEVFSLDMIASILFAFFTAGHETTSSLLGNALYQLLRRPGYWERLGREPELTGNAVEELLRYDSSVISWRRQAKQDMQIGGVTIPEGAQLLLLLGAANHDESVFPDADQLDIERTNAAQHLSFGSGIHRCLGAALTQMEARVTLDLLSQRLPGMTLAADQTFDYLPNIAFHGPRAVQVCWPIPPHASAPRDKAAPVTGAARPGSVTEAATAGSFAGAQLHNSAVPADE